MWRGPSGRSRRSPTSPLLGDPDRFERLIAAERDKLDLDAVLANRPGEQLRLAAITVAELHEGVERADSRARAEKRRALIESYISRMPVADLDAAITREYARLRVSLMAVSTVIGAHDLQIAVTALVIGYQVATKDLRSFPGSQGSSASPGDEGSAFEPGFAPSPPAPTGHGDAR
jgi:tRNA(fMet)-specific endonuclease VapC